MAQLPDRLTYTPQVTLPNDRGFGAGLISVQSPLLGESLLFSFPPLSNMLKFSGCSRLNRGRNSEYMSYAYTTDFKFALCTTAHTSLVREVSSQTRSRLVRQTSTTL